MSACRAIASKIRRDDKSRASGRFSAFRADPKRPLRRAGALGQCVEGGLENLRDRSSTDLNRYSRFSATVRGCPEMAVTCTFAAGQCPEFVSCDPEYPPL